MAPHPDKERLFQVKGRSMNNLPPFQRHSDTSLEAAKSIYPKVGTLRRRVYDFIRGRGKAGATDFEIEYFQNIPGSTVRPRRRELELAGLVTATDMRRATASGRAAVVWVAQDSPKPGEQVGLEL